VGLSVSEKIPLLRKRKREKGGSRGGISDRRGEKERIGKKKAVAFRKGNLFHLIEREVD